MDSKRLRHFLAIYDSGSLGQAAAVVHVTQPALTKSIKQLEDRLQVKLFDRTPLGVVPTVYGEALAVHAKAIQAEVRAAETQLAMLRGAAGGHVVVGIGPTLATDLMPLATAQLFRRKPGIQVTVVEGLLEDLIPALRRGELDLAITACSMGSDADLVSETIFRDKVGILCSATHPLATQASIAIKEMLNYPWALPTQKVAWRRCLDDLFFAEGLAPPAAIVTSTSAFFLRALLLQGSFISYLPHRLVAAEVRAGQIVSLPVPNAVLDIEGTLTYRKRTAMAVAMRELIDILHSIVAKDF